MNRNLLRSFLCLLVVISPLQPLSAFDFSDLLQPVALMQYDHHHIRKNKITGYTKIERKTMVKGDKSVFLEIAVNLDRKGKVFSEKRTLFDAETGDLLSYSESDFRTATSISNRIVNDSIQTRIQSEKEVLEVSLEMEKGIVPFEVLPLFLRQSLDRLQAEGSLSFTLYIPVMAIELKRKGLPASLSKLEMSARITETKKVETIFGIKPVVQVVLKPTSFLINTILPKERTAFYFSFLQKTPHTLISFRENKTESMLSEHRP